jgi:TRAP-type C4-dicarboxylate transport system permease small subunit
MPASNQDSVIARTLNIIHLIEDGMLVGLLLIMLFLASSQILLRNLFEVGMVWADPLLRIFVLWLGLLGALAASRDNKHITIDVLTRLMPARVSMLTHIFTSLFTATVCGIIAYHSVRFVMQEYESATVSVAGLPAWIYEIIIPFAFALIGLRYLLRFSQLLREALTIENQP